MRVMTFRLRVQDGVDDVFERLWSGRLPSFVHVADEKRGDVWPFAVKQELRRRFADLADAAGAPTETSGKTPSGMESTMTSAGLMRAISRGSAQAGFSQQIERRLADREALAA